MENNDDDDNWETMQQFYLLPVASCIVSLITEHNDSFIVEMETNTSTKDIVGFFSHVNIDDVCMSVFLH